MKADLKNYVHILHVILAVLTCLLTIFFHGLRQKSKKINMLSYALYEGNVSPEIWYNYDSDYQIGILTGQGVFEEKE